MKLTIAAACALALSNMQPSRAVLVQHHQGSMHPVEAHLLQLQSMPWSGAALLELAGAVDKMDFSGHDPSSDLFVSIGTMITNTMIPGILASKNSTQEQLNNFRAAFDTCPDPKPAAGSGPSSLGDDAETKFTATDKCREQEAAAAKDHSDCLAALSPIESSMESACNALKKKDTEPVDPFLCSPTDPYDQWLKIADNKVTDLEKHLTGLEHGCGNATELHEAKSGECAGKDAAQKGNKTVCDTLQSQAEAAICSAKGTEGGACATYETCYNNAVSAYTEQNASIIAMHLNWTVQWRTLKRMTCLLDIMQKGGTNADIDACKAKLWDTSHLDLAYPAIPDRKECSGLAQLPEPCEPDFLAKYYGNNPVGAPAAPCTPCSPPPGATTTTTTYMSSGILYGGEGGQLFNDFTAGRHGIESMCVWSGSMIDAIQVTYKHGDRSPKYGGEGGSVKCIELAAGEHIVAMTIRSGGLVDGFTIHTSSGADHKFGGDGGGSHRLNAPEVLGQAQIVSFWGKYGGMLDALGVYWAPYGDN